MGRSEEMCCYHQKCSECLLIYMQLGVGRHRPDMREDEKEKEEEGRKRCRQSDKQPR